MFVLKFLVLCCFWVRTTYEFRFWAGPFTVGKSWDSMLLYSYDKSSNFIEFLDIWRRLFYDYVRCCCWLIMSRCGSRLFDFALRTPLSALLWVLILMFVIFFSLYISPYIPCATSCLFCNWMSSCCSLEFLAYDSDFLYVSRIDECPPYGNSLEIDAEFSFSVFLSFWYRLFDLSATFLASAFRLFSGKLIFCTNILLLLPIFITYSFSANFWTYSVCSFWYPHIYSRISLFSFSIFVILFWASR